MITKRMVTVSKNNQLTQRKILVVELNLTRKDGTKERYRRDASIQTVKAAKLEEAALLRQWFETGTLKPAKPEPITPEPVKAVPVWEDALEHYRQRGLKDLKESARRSFEWAYGSRRFHFWAGVPISEITTTKIAEWQRAILEEGFIKKGKAGTMSASLMNACRAALLAVLR